MSILTTAEEIINGQRAKDYGDARENHQRIADLWKVYLNGKADGKRHSHIIEPEDVAVMMILLKIARFMENGYHHDTVVDIAGYAGVLEKMQLPEGERYARTPREWLRLDDVPKDVKVVDQGGHRWSWTTTTAYGDSRWLWSSNGGRVDGSRYKAAPFTEVLARHDQKDAT